ncbi:hypothetical protein L0244_29555, partial [bacterium]|nr:hypothetical protein [bacterium]
MKISVVLVLFLIPLLLLSQTQTKNAGEYVCPPCGCSSDDKVFNAPGSCPVCGMPLVPKEQAEQEQSMKAAILIFDGV